MKRFSIISMIFLILILGCSKSEETDIDNLDSGAIEDIIPDDLERVDYELLSVSNSNVSGTASLIRNENGSATIFIQLENASSGLHPATVNFGSLEEGGSVAITLERCECEISETLITQLDDGTPITFDELMIFDGHLNIYESPSDASIISSSNIGSNAF